MVSVQVTGLKELQQKLLAMGQKVGLKAIRTALVSGAQIIKKDAITRVPVKTGRMKNSILVKRLPKPNPFKEQVIVGVRSGKKYQKSGRDAFYWKFIEFGHKDRSGNSISPKPFIVPAFQTRKASAMDRIKVVLQNKIRQYVKERA